MKQVTIRSMPQLIKICKKAKNVFLSTTESGDALHHHFIEYNEHTQSFESAEYSQSYYDPAFKEERSARPVSTTWVLRAIGSYSEKYVFSPEFLEREAQRVASQI